MTKEEKSEPKIRFPGFTDPWEQRRLGEVADSVEYGINAPAKEYDGINKYLRITDIDDTTHEFLQSDLTSPDTDLTLAEKFKLLEGDILFARTGASVGKSYIYSREDGSVYYAGFLIRMRFNKSISPDFIFQNTLTTAYKQYVEVTSQRSGQPGVNAKEYSNYSLYIPSKEEQQKIGSFFQQLDTLIALHQRKLEHLKQQKKGLLQKMFPKNGESVPEVHFPGFTGAWEQRRFEDISKLSQGLQIAISKRFTHPGDGKLFYITNEFLNPNSTVKYYIDSPAKNVIAGKTDILMTRTGNTGKVVTDVEGVYHNNFFKISYNSSKTDRWFLYYLLNSYPIQREILVRAGNSTIPDLNHNDFYRIKIYIPTIEEQIKIGTFLTKVDSLIALHHRKLENLRELKKYLLQNMFI